MNIASLANLNFFDAILSVVILTSASWGFLKGIIRMLGEFIGFVVGIWIAGHYFTEFYNWTQLLYFNHENIGLVVSFLFLLFVTRKLIVLIVVILDRFFNFLGIIPFFSLLNRLAGTIFGLASAGIVTGMFIYFASRYSLGFSFDKLLVDSVVAPVVLKFAEFFSPLLPQIIRGVHSLI